MKKKCATVVLALLISILPDIGFSRTNLSIKPKISAASRYDSNFYLSETNEVEVYSYLLQPGIQFGLKTPKTNIKLDYDFEAYFYEGKGSESSGIKKASDQNYYGHLISLDSQYDATSKLSFGFNDTFYHTRYPANYDRLSDNTYNIIYDINRMTPSVLYNIKDRFSLGLRYRRTDVAYEGIDGQGSTEHRELVDLNYNPNRRTSVGINYQHWLMDNELDESDYTSDQIGINLQKRFKYYTLDANTGYHVRSFENSQLDNADTVSFKVSFTGQNPPPPELNRPPGESFVRSKSHFYIAAERNFNNYGSYFTADRFTMSVGHVFARKIMARIRGYYQVSDYDAFDETGLARKDNTFNISGTLSYLIKKNLSLSFTAGREERDSSLPRNSYENNFFTLTFDFNYDFSGRGGHTEESLYY